MKYSRLLKFLAPSVVLSSLNLSVVQITAQADSNGCGSGRTAAITPNAPAGVSFKTACDRHDVCYDTLGSDRRSCDDQFHNDMLTACREAYPDGSFFGQSIRKPQRITCNGAADLYYQAVLSEGGSAHQEAQRAASNRANQNQQQQKSSANNKISFKNSCSHPIQVAIHFQNLQNQWETKAWYSFSPGESSRLNGVDTKNRYLYYYAETTDRSNIVWKGNDTSETIGGRVYNMLKFDIGSKIVNWTQNLNCN
jgi:Group XII secretory phospholipase A2 precursor (PLA2G12)/Protein of unknown function (DUF1036)